MSGVSRRNVLRFGLGAAAAAGFAPLPLARLAQAQTPTLPAGFLQDAMKDEAAYYASITKGLAFQNAMMDAYASGNTVRLIQSYADQSGLESTAFTYDNAVAIHAYLLRGDADSLRRAQVLGNGLIYAQATNFPFNDGRFAQAYFVNAPNGDGSGAYVTPAAFPFYFYGSAVGDQAWAGMALAQLYYKTGLAKYRTAALSVANWIVNNTYNTQGPGGYSFGTNINQFNESVPSPNGKSTEHNIDTYAFFTMLNKLTNYGRATNGMTWTALAQHALSFVLAMYNAADGYFFTGTNADQVSINYYPVPEDVQTWSYMATLNNTHAGTIDWALKNLQAVDTAAAPQSSLTGVQTFTGMVFDSASLNTTTFDPNAVWLEGTAHTIAALVARVIAGDPSTQAKTADLEMVLKFLIQSQSAQDQLGVGQTVGGVSLEQGNGLVAATSVMDTGFGYTYGTALHVGATGWYLIAAQGGNPFRLGYLSK